MSCFTLIELYAMNIKPSGCEIWGYVRFCIESVHRAGDFCEDTNGEHFAGWYKQVLSNHYFFLFFEIRRQKWELLRSGILWDPLLAP